jgi:hypothetical protein
VTLPSLLLSVGATSDKCEKRPSLPLEREGKGGRLTFPLHNAPLYACRRILQSWQSARRGSGRPSNTHYRTARRRDKRAAKQFFRKLLTGLIYVPRVIITDKLKSYAAAKCEILSGGGIVNLMDHSLT